MIKLIANCWVISMLTMGIYSQVFSANVEIGDFVFLGLINLIGLIVVAWLNKLKHKYND